MKSEEAQKLYASVLDRILLAGDSNLQLVAAVYDEQGKVLRRQKKQYTYTAFLFNRLADGKVRACINNDGKVDDLMGMSKFADWWKVQISEILPCLLFGGDCKVKGVVKYKLADAVTGYISVSGAVTSDLDLEAIEEGLRGVVQDSNGVYELESLSLLTL